MGRGREHTIKIIINYINDETKKNSKKYMDLKRERPFHRFTMTIWIDDVKTCDNNQKSNF